MKASFGIAEHNMVCDEVIDIELGKWENHTPSVMYMELFISQ